MYICGYFFERNDELLRRLVVISAATNIAKWRKGPGQAGISNFLACIFQRLIMRRAKI